MQIKKFLGANVSGKGAFFYVWGHLVFGAFVNGGNFIFSGGNFINIRGNQSKIVGKMKNFGGNLKNNGGKCVSGI